MARSADTLNLHVTLSGASSPAMLAAAEELDELVQDTVVLLDEPGDMAELFRAMRRGMKTLMRNDESDESVFSFLDSVISDSDRDVQADVEAAAIAIGRDFARRDAVIDDALSTPDAMKLVKLTRQALNGRWKSGKLIGFMVNGNVRYPSWQFDAKSPTSVVDGLDEVLAVLSGQELSTLDQIFWLTSPRPEFDDAAPVDALRQGMKEAVVAQARSASVS